MGKGEKILISGDNKTLADLSLLLEDSGYTVKVANGGNKAFECLADFKPDLLISIVGTSHPDAYELCRKIDAYESWNTLPVLLLAELYEPEDILACLECDADSYVLLPYRDRILLDKIKYAINNIRHRKIRENRSEYTYFIEGRKYEIKTTKDKMINMLLSINETARDNNKKLSEAKDELITLNCSLENQIEKELKNLKEKISQKKALEETLVQNEIRYNRLAEHADIGIFIAQNDGIIVKANSAFTKILDIRNPRYLINKNLKTFFDIPENFNQLSKKISIEKNLHIEELKMLTIKRMPRWVVMNLVGSGDRIRGIVIDKTSKKFKEERNLHFQEGLRNAKQHAELSDQQKSKFLSGMSYYVKAPLNKIAAYTELLADPNLGANRINAYKKEIRLNTIELNTKIINILNLAKLETNKISLSENEVLLSKLMERIREEFTERIQLRNNTNLQLNIESNESSKKLIVILDENCLTEVLKIMVDNSIRYSLTGTIVLKAICKSSKLIISVSDSGPGIRKDDQNYLFQRFSQLNTTAFIENAGIGLTIAHKMISLMGGTIMVESEIGEGSKFIITLPLKVKKLDQYQQKAEVLARNISNLNHKTILVAEDNYENYLLLVAYLEYFYVRIIWAKDGAEVINKFKSGIEIDAIIMDINMPVVNGMHAIKKIRETDKNIPIIAVTALAGEEDQKIVKSLGANDYIIKPVSKEILLAALVRNLNN